MRGFFVEILKDYHVEETFGEFCLDFFLVTVGHFLVSPGVVVLYMYTICLFKTYFSCIHTCEENRHINPLA